MSILLDRDSRYRAGDGLVYELPFYALHDLTADPREYVRG